MLKNISKKSRLLMLLGFSAIAILFLLMLVGGNKPAGASAAPSGSEADSSVAVVHAVWDGLSEAPPPQPISMARIAIRAALSITIRFLFINLPPLNNTRKYRAARAGNYMKTAPPARVPTMCNLFYTNFKKVYFIKPDPLILKK